MILTEMMLKKFEDECNSFSICPCGLFVLNKRRILGFVTSLITLTVMFVQISDDNSQRKMNTTKVDLRYNESLDKVDSSLTTEMPTKIWLTHLSGDDFGGDD